MRFWPRINILHSFSYFKNPMAQQIIHGFHMGHFYKQFEAENARGWDVTEWLRLLMAILPEGLLKLKIFPKSRQNNNYGLCIKEKGSNK